MNIRSKILYAFLAVTAITIFFSGITVFDSMRDMVMHIAEDSLKNETVHRKRMIEEYIDRLKNNAIIAKEIGAVTDALSKVIDGKNKITTRDLLLLDKDLSMIQKFQKFEDIMLIDTSGKIVHSYNKMHEKVDRGRLLDEYVVGGFERGKKEIFVSDIFRSRFKEGTYEFGMIAIAPVVNTKGEFLGEVALEVNANELYSIIRGETDPSKSRETILSRKKNETQIEILSPLRYKKNAVLNDVVTIGSEITTGVQPANTQLEGGGIMNDYREVICLSYWSYIPSMKWRILTKVDEREIMEGVGILGANFILILFMALVGVAAVSRSISKAIVMPLEHLQRTTRELLSGSSGTVRNIEVTASDESGKLAEAFNVMSSRLRGLYSHLDSKVKQRTETIEREKSKFLALSENLPIGVMMVEVGNHKIVAINKAMINLLMINKSPLGKKIEALSRTHINFINENGKVIPTMQTSLMKTVNMSNEGKVETQDIQLDRSHQGDGIIWVRTIVSTINDEKGRKIFVTMVMEDITKEKQIDRAKSEFVSLASHQFRTPLTAINWYIEILLKECGSKMTARQKELVTEVANGGQRLGVLVNTMLNISRIDMDTFTLNLKKVDARSVTKKVLHDIDRRIKNHHLHIVEEYQMKLPKIMADESALEIIIQNLVTNAVKYTRVNGNILVQVSVAKKGASIGGKNMVKNSFIILVKDNGYGIKKSDQKNIFGRFYRASNVNNIPAEGTGLGLYFVKKMLDNMGGGIWFESEENKGSSFYVSLPLTGMQPHKGRGTGAGKKLETLSAASIEAEIPSIRNAKEEETPKKKKK